MATPRAVSSFNLNESFFHLTTSVTSVLQSPPLFYIGTFISLFVVSSIFKLLKNLRAVSFLPGLRVPFQPFSIFAILLPETWWNPSKLFTWSWRKNNNIYDRYGCDTVSIVPFIGNTPMIYTRSMEVGRRVVIDGQRSGAFGKSYDMGRFFLFWGPNIVAAEGESWRRHRKVTSPAFNNEMYSFVWDASRKLYMEMAATEGWTAKDVFEVPSVHTLTSKFAFVIFASVGFGIPISWANLPAHQGEMSIQECMEIITKTNLFAIAAPPWAWKLPFPWIKRTRRAYDTMRAFMHSLVSTTRKNIQSGDDDTATKPKDIFWRLVRASEDAGSKIGLSDHEVIGNVFSFLFAGHETSAHTLAATLAFLALDHGLQDELVAQVREVTRGRADDTLLMEDYSKLDKILGAFYEGIRMFPAGVLLAREALHDTILNISDNNEPKMLSIKKGTFVIVDMVGVQYHERYFSEPEEFRPSRWYKQDSTENESEEYTAFSFGPRACLGRKFASMEGVCFLAMLLRDWRIEPLFAMQPNGQLETVDEWRDRVLQAKVDITLGINDVPLRFVRRT